MIPIVLLISWFWISPRVDQGDVVHPLKLEACLEQPNITSAASVDLRMNPYYLRGDFDGDRRPDFAVAISGRKSNRGGVLFCLARGKRLIVGGDSSEASEKDVFAPNWEVATVAEVLEFRKTNSRVPVPKAESILMVWEDGMHYIYWDGAKFRVSPTVL